MAKQPKKKEVFEAVTIVRTTELLCKCFKLTIEDGRVIESVEITRADDLPGIAIGHAQRSLWYQYRHNKHANSRPGLPEPLRPEPIEVQA